MLLKLGLNKNFPQNVLCSRKSTLRIGIMPPSMTLFMLKAKSYAGNVRVKGITSEVIAVQEEHMQVEAGRETSVGCNSSERYWYSM